MEWLIKTRSIRETTVSAPAGVLDKAVAPTKGGRDAAGRLEVRIVSGLAGLLSLKEDWEALLASVPERSFVHEMEWHSAHLGNLEPAPEAVYFCSFFRGGRPLAIFPLRYGSYEFLGMSIKAWQMPTHPHVPLADVLISSACDPSEVAEALVATLDELGLPWNAIRFPGLPEKSPLVTALRGRTVGGAFTVCDNSSMYFCCRDLLTALADASPDFRRNLRRQRKKLEQHGEVTLSVARNGAELDRAFAHFLRLEASGWKGRAGSGTAIVLHPKLFSYYREVKERFAERDACRVALLRLNGVPIAAQFGLVVDRTLYVHGMAYDEQWHAEAPGHQLLHDVLEYCSNAPEIARLSLIAAPAWADGRWNPRRFRLWEGWIFKAGAVAAMCMAVRWLAQCLGNRTRVWWRFASERWTPSCPGGR